MVLGKTLDIGHNCKECESVPGALNNCEVLGFFYAQCVSLILLQTIRVFLVRHNYHVFAQNCRLYEKAPAVDWGRMGTLPLGALALLVLWCCCWSSGALALLEGSCSRAPLTGFWASAMLCSSFLFAKFLLFSSSLLISNKIKRANVSS